MVDFKVGICKFLRLLMEVVCVIPLILAVIMMGDTHHNCDKIGLRMAHLSIFQVVAFVGIYHYKM